MRTLSVIVLAFSVAGCAVEGRSIVEPPTYGEHLYAKVYYHLPGGVAVRVRAAGEHGSKMLQHTDFVPLEEPLYIRPGELRLKYSCPSDKVERTQVITIPTAHMFALVCGSSGKLVLKRLAGGA